MSWIFARSPPSHDILISLFWVQRVSVSARERKSIESTTMKAFYPRVCVWWRKVGLDAGSPPPHAWLTDWLTYWQTKEKREWKKKKKRLSMTIKSASGESSRVRAFETLLLSFSLFNSLLLLSCIISQLCNRWWNGEFGERDGRWQSRLINSIVSFYLFCMVKTLL